MMTTDAYTLIDGQKVSESLLDSLAIEIKSTQSKVGREPGLAVILVGNNPASKAYVGRKKAACERIGIRSFEYLLPAEASQDELVDLIATLNNDEQVDGILLQLPLSPHHDESYLLQLISPEKDVDGFHPQNVGKLLLGLPTLKSCTPYGVMELLNAYSIDLEGKEVVIIGRSNIVGKPLAAMMITANATVTVAHSRTKCLADVVKRADIVVAAVGKARFVTADMVKPGAVVIDVGINKVDDSSAKNGYRLVGDVDFDNVAPVTSFITPVPGGVGPMTIAMLMKNTIAAWNS